MADRQRLVASNRLHRERRHRPGASREGATHSASKFPMATADGASPRQTSASRPAARKPASSTWRTSSCPARRTTCACAPTSKSIGTPIEWAQGRPDAQLKITHLDPSPADLHYRGYSVVNQANASSPELPQYNRIAASTQIWRDLEGYYTRYGDVAATACQPSMTATSS